jgi:hypothetical protein
MINILTVYSNSSIGIVAGRKHLDYHTDKLDLLEYLTPLRGNVADTHVLPEVPHIHFGDVISVNPGLKGSVC